MSVLIKLYEQTEPEKLSNLAKITHFEMDGTDLSSGNEQVFTDLNYILMRMPKLSKINLIGTGIGDNLGEILEALRQPGIQNICLRQSGLTKECTSAFAKYMVNFENIIELDLSTNWFGIQGLFEIKDQLARFK